MARERLRGEREKEIERKKENERKREKSRERMRAREICNVNSSLSPDHKLVFDLPLAHRTALDLVCTLAAVAEAEAGLEHDGALWKWVGVVDDRAFCERVCVHALVRVYEDVYETAVEIVLVLVVK